MAPKPPKREHGRRTADKVPARIKAVGSAIAGIITAVVLALINYSTGQKSNAPAVDNAVASATLEAKSKETKRDEDMKQIMDKLDKLEKRK